MTTHEHPLGKTTFLCFMLTRLVSARQVVVLVDRDDIHLFYRGQVYQRRKGFAFGTLPVRQGVPYCPIWALIDMGDKNEQPCFGGSSNVWPIQTSSPNPIQWKSWTKQCGAAKVGMPLWNMKELMEGYVSTSSPFLPSILAMLFERFIANCPFVLLDLVFTPNTPNSEAS